MLRHNASISNSYYTSGGTNFQNWSGQWLMRPSVRQVWPSNKHDPEEKKALTLVDLESTSGISSNEKRASCELVLMAQGH